MDNPPNISRREALLIGYCREIAEHLRIMNGSYAKLVRDMQELEKPATQDNEFGPPEGTVA